MNGLTFPESPNRRNAPWSAYRDDYGGESEPTDEQLLYESVADEVRILLGQARRACNLGGITVAQLGPIEALAKSWGVR